MKSASIPSLRVEPGLRQAAEGVLREGETLSSFVEESVRMHVERRLVAREFIERGLASRDESKANGEYHDADAIHAELAEMLREAQDQGSAH